jgi:acyl-coenzyme A thioesterase PaaI-like protein
VIHLGGRTATAEARITDSQGRLCAHMGTTLMVMDIPKDA